MIGKVGYNTYYSKYEIIEYNGANDIVVMFENGYKKKTTMRSFKSGNIRSPYDRTFLGVGYIGEGVYNSKHKSYRVWGDMLYRCYGENSSGMNSVDENWLNYQNFASWYENNFYQIGKEKMILSKDIVFKDCKVYSEDNCLIVPNKLNGLFVSRHVQYGLPECNRFENDNLLPDGVRYDSASGKYISEVYKSIGVDRKGMYRIGEYKSVKMASRAYNREKVKYVRKVVGLYRKRFGELISDRVYDSVENRLKIGL